MGFFDFNVPYFESDKPITDNPARKTTRLKLIVKAMELGYTGIAYNRLIKGVMSESDHCTISLFPLSSVLKLSPSLTSTVNFHRNLLGVPVSTPFRQYTRLTVIVDSSSQASALNSGNPILKSYDIVAVRPLNQNAFEQACRASEVDLIAIDFSEKLPYRLKQPLVKAAIERGVYFEITYSSLILDAQVRRQMISSAKLLVDWTRGKNIIFSSAAPSITELRGPYDVANLMTLLGIPMERAKVAISKNCRSLITNSLRKKKFYKEAIRVELVSLTEQCRSKDPEFGEWLKWDPISSGEGDLLLDEMAKSFAASNKASNRSKAIDFASIVDSLPPQGLQIKNPVPITKLTSKLLNSDNNLFLVKKALEPVVASRASEKEGMFDILSEAHQTSLGYKISNSGDSAILADDTAKGLTEVSNGLVNYDNELDCVHSQTCTSICEPPEMFPADNADDMGNKSNETEEDAEMEVSLHVCLANREAEVHDLQPDGNMLISSEECKLSSSSDLVLDTQDVMDEIMAESDIKVDAMETFTMSEDDTNVKGESNLSFASNLSSHETITNSEHFKGTGGGAAILLDDSSVLESNDSLLANCEPWEDTTIQEQNLQSGRPGVKRKMSHHARLFPFKRLWNHVPVKKRGRILKRKT